MGRIAMVTRTINFTEVTALTVDVVAQSTATHVYTLSGTFTENDKLIKALKKEFETDTIKVVSVLSTTVNEKLYGMTEQEFMSLAKVLPPRKIYGADDTDTQEQEVEQPVEQEVEQPVAPAHNNKKGKRKGK
mgnify:CR=1 FL=1